MKKYLARLLVGMTIWCMNQECKCNIITGCKKHTHDTVPGVAMSDRKWAWPNISTALSMETLGTARLQK